jgi:hypothetical protein
MYSSTQPVGNLECACATLELSISDKFLLFPLLLLLTSCLDTGSQFISSYLFDCSLLSMQEDKSQVSYSHEVKNNYAGPGMINIFRFFIYIFSYSHMNISFVCSFICKVQISFVCLCKSVCAFRTHHFGLHSSTSHYCSY